MHWDSNSKPFDYKSNALPIELYILVYAFGRTWTFSFPILSRTRLPVPPQRLNAVYCPAKSHNGNALVCKTNYKGSSPFLALLRESGPVAQLVERTPDKGKAGSSTLPRFNQTCDEQLIAFFREKKMYRYYEVLIIKA